eukprot:144864-Chlamydomonas_euryale.AAC.6
MRACMVAYRARRAEGQAQRHNAARARRKASPPGTTSSVATNSRALSGDTASLRTTAPCGTARGRGSAEAHPHRRHPRCLTRANPAAHGPSDRVGRAGANPPPNPPPLDKRSELPPSTHRRATVPTSPMAQASSASIAAALATRLSALPPSTRQVPWTATASAAAGDFRHGKLDRRRRYGQVASTCQAGRVGTTVGALCGGRPHARRA